MNDIINFITTNFWIFLLIGSLLLCKDYRRMMGIILLLIQIIWGLIPWILVTIIVLSCLIELSRWYHKLESMNKKPMNQNFRKDVEEEKRTK